MKNFKRIVAIILTAILAICVLPSGFAEAKAAKVPAKPTIKVKATKDNTIKVTISKTKNADGFKVYYSRAEDPSGIYYEIEISKNGKKARSVTISNLEAGKYKVFVEPYAKKYIESYDDYERIYGYLSKTKTVKVKTNKTADKNVNNNATPIDLAALSGLQNGDTFKFGSYEQDNNLKNGSEAIEWIVLQNSNNELFAVSKYALDCKPYNETRVDVTWETCSLRKWLNTDFYNEAFNKSEQKLIKTVTVKNNDHPRFETEGGNDTQDRIILLSMDEVMNTTLYGFSDSENADEARMCIPTSYAIAKGIMYREGHRYQTSESDTACYWLLRSPGREGTTSEFVHPGGELDDDGLVDGEKLGTIRMIVDGKRYYSINVDLGNNEYINEKIEKLKKDYKEHLIAAGEKNSEDLINKAEFRLIYDKDKGGGRFLGVRPALVINLNP